MKNPPLYHLVGYRADGRRVNRRYRRLESALAMQRKMQFASMQALFTVSRQIFDRPIKVETRP